LESLLTEVQARGAVVRAFSWAPCVTDRGERVTEIEYSAYDAMADAEIERILTEAAQQWHGVRVALRHRVGRVPVGEASIAIVAAAPHRAEAFAACRHVIEAVKRRLPIWKKEYRVDGVRPCATGLPDGSTTP